MNGKTRRENIISRLKLSSAPISGTALAEIYSVSRQVIVQDIALIRASGYDIMSTNKGYIINAPSTVSKVFKVSHTDEEIEDELCTIVDLGGKITDVFVFHRAYGKISCVLNVSSRHNVKNFINDLHTGVSTPLKNITSSFHYHTVEAPNEETLDLIEKALAKKGYLVSDN